MVDLSSVPTSGNHILISVEKKYHPISTPSFHQGSEYWDLIRTRMAWLAVSRYVHCLWALVIISNDAFIELFITHVHLFYTVERCDNEYQYISTTFDKVCTKLMKSPKFSVG
jgi:hypothetical protein